MKRPLHKAVAIVGVGAVMPDAPNLPQFWQNLKDARYSISDVPQGRWSLENYYREDRKVPDKTYSKLGGWVTDDGWDPMKWRLPIPPKVSAQMDRTQKWAITASREALMDFGYPDKEFDGDRTAVILGVAMGGDQHLFSAARIMFPEYVDILSKSEHFSDLPAEVRKNIVAEMQANLGDIFPQITEDTMPGELSNIVAGRIAALFNFHGPNYITDAACASALAAISAAIEGLEEYDYDLVVTGGIDANMSASTFVKFSKIGALSATGTRPYADGADGFIMGEGGAIFVLKRLDEAERDGDKIYAVIRSIAGSSDGKGKGITAPNPIGQQLAVKRAWSNAGLSPKSVSLIEGHGTSTSVGDAVELMCLNEVFKDLNIPAQSVALGSVKSNIGHLKGAAGAAGIMKTTMALHNKMLPPSVNFTKPNSGFDFDNSPFAVNTQLRPWDLKNGDPRRAGVSAFGFGGTNFHVVMEEYIPGRITSEQKTQVAMAESSAGPAPVEQPKAPLRGAFVKGSSSADSLLRNLEATNKKLEGGWTPEITAPLQTDLNSKHRIAIHYTDATDLKDKIERTIKGLRVNKAGVWKALNAKGIFYGSGPASKTAFLFTGQGSQYVNMLQELRRIEPVVADTFDEADKVMTPIFGKPLSAYIFADANDAEAMKNSAEQLKQTEITQPAVLTVDIALYRLMKAYGMQPDFVMGHSLGEYGALVASEAMSFAEALKAVSARGSEMAKVKVDDQGIMAAVFGSTQHIREILDSVDGYVEIANNNSYGQSVIGGESEPVIAAMAACKKAGLHVAQLPVSHAFHTRIVAPASEPLKRVLSKCGLQSPSIPLIANVTGDFYPMGTDVVPQMVDILAKQVASPVQFVKGLNTLYDRGVRVFIEMGPKKALNGFVRDVMAGKDDVSNLFSNHPKVGDLSSFNQGLCGLYAAGVGNGRAVQETPAVKEKPVEMPKAQPVAQVQAKTLSPGKASRTFEPTSTHSEGRYEELGKLFVDFMDKANSVYSGGEGRALDDIWITGASLGLPKVDKVFQDSNVKRLLNGEQFIENIDDKFLQEMLEKNITRLVKTGKGGPRFETIDQIEEVIKLAARKSDLNIVRDFGFPQSRAAALDATTELAIGAGIDALRDAGIPLVMHYKTTTTGSRLPDRWLLPQQMRDDTGIIFASAFPGYNAYAKEITDFYEDKIKRDKIAILEGIRGQLQDQNGGGLLINHVNTQLQELKSEVEKSPYSFNRRFLLRVLSMGHSQFAEYIGARGPNTQINAACASTTQALGMAKDWIDAGRCKRVIVIAGDDITADDTLGWFTSGFLAAGAAATDDKVENAALPFDKRRHGMIVGMGGAAIVVESGSSAQHRGIQPICEVLGTTYANSAFHGTRLDIDHIRMIMDDMVSKAEQQWGVSRHDMAKQMVFVSHETYTPARGGSASAEINALRHVFKSSADDIVIANTKGMTGHAMAVGIEDVLAIKALETGLVPPVPNFKEIDPELGQLNLSKGGSYPIAFALRLGAGFGSQISMSLLRWTPVGTGVRPDPDNLGFNYRIADEKIWTNWLKEVSGQDNPDLEVIKRTLRIKDPLADKLTDVKETAPATAQPAQKAVQAQPAVVQAEPATAVTTAVNPVQTKILELIAEKTGYPVDMLDPELDLEADLGIDTVKQAELFAEIRGEYGIERDDALQLADFPTLNHIIGFVFDKKPELRQSAAPVVQQKVEPAQPAVISTPQSAGGKTEIEQKVLSLIAEKTGYPEDMLDLELDLEADLGIDTVKQAELFAEVRGSYGIERDETLQLAEFPTLNHIIQFVLDKRPDLAAASTAVPVVTPDSTSVSAPQESPVTEPVSKGSVGDGVQQKVLTLIAEKTGYPEDMLELDLDLEADLGIDTVKQAELFAEIRGEYGIDRDDNLQLAEFPTLNHIIQFVYDKKPELATAAVSVPVSEPQPVSAQSTVETSTASTSVATQDGVKETILTLIAEKTGYPEDMLELDLDLEADLGIDTVKQAELFAEIRGEYGIERDDNLQLADYPTLNHIIGFVHEKRPDIAASVAAPPTTEPVASQDPVESTVSTASADDDVKTQVLNLVAEKTGYPEDMLDLDLDLEADLGIDTVKQAELFADIRGVYGIERDETLQLADYPTLNHIIGFVNERKPDVGSSSTKVSEAISGSNGLTPGINLAQGDLEAVSQIPRRIPIPQLLPDLEYCKAAGVTLDKDSHVIVMMDTGGVGKALVTQLKKKGVTVRQLKDVASRKALSVVLKDWSAQGPFTGVYWLPGLDIEKEISQMSYDEWKATTESHVKLLYATMRELVMSQDEPAFLVSGTRMGGQLGYDPKGALSSLGGAISGFTKAYKREHSEAQVKVVDFEKSRKTTAFAKTLVDETLYDPGAVEIGHKNGKRWTIGLREMPLSDDKDGMQLDQDTTFLVTGAAGSITSAITADLAQASGGTFYLMDLTPVPDKSDPDLVRFASDKEGLKRDIFTRLKEAGEKATPVMVDKALSAIERKYSALAAIEAIENAGGTAHYYSVNLLDHKAMKKAVKSIVKDAKKIDVLLHAGGIEISRMLPDKSENEFDLVFDIKADGWYNLVSSLGDTPLGAAVVFSSIAGRFGNGGQTDYSAANDFLCKSISGFRTTKPETRGLALDWTAWKDIGMAARGSIPTVMKQAGIDMLPPEAGIPFIRKELITSKETTEIVVAQNLGIMLEEFDVTGGLDTAPAGPVDQLIKKSKGVMIQKALGMGIYSGFTTKAMFDPKEQGFLYDHEINGKPVLPGVMGIEAMVEAATLLFPDLHFKAVEGVDFKAPFKFYRSEPRDVMVKVVFEQDGSDLIGHCELFGARKLHGQEQEEVTTHFTAKVRMSKKPQKTPDPLKPQTAPSSKKSTALADDIYKLYFHGPAYQVIEKSWIKGDATVGLFAKNMPPNHSPETLQTMAMPRLVELCFQTAGIKEMGTEKYMGLPEHIESLQIYQHPKSSRARLYAVVDQRDGSYDADIVDSKGEVYLSLKGYKTAEFITEIDKKLLEPLAVAMD